ncbi:MAG TPA: methyltransferase [Conexibacter sp.]|nr:methyltransferase [Conexibacter sp.]
MSELLLTLGWRTSRDGALRFIGVIGAVTVGIVIATLALGEITGIPAIVVQLAMWTGWLLWLGIFFPRSRLRMDASDCEHPYHLAFVRELLPGIGVNFALLLRPAALGLFEGPTPHAGVPALAGVCLTIGGVALIASATNVIGIARAFFVHEYEDVRGGLVARGVYEHMRHPLFIGGMALSLGLALLVGVAEGVELAALNVAILPAYLYFEERRCSIVIGEPYRRYRSATGAVLPRGWHPLQEPRRRRS